MRLVLLCVIASGWIVAMSAFSYPSFLATTFGFKLILTLLEWRRNFVHFVPTKLVSLSAERGVACMCFIGLLFFFFFPMQHILIKHQLARLTWPPRPVAMYACAKFVSTPSLVSPNEWMNEWLQIRAACTASLSVTCAHRGYVKCWLSSFWYLNQLTLVPSHVFDPAS